MKIWLFLGLLIIFFIEFVDLFGFKVCITNDNIDMISCKKICVRINFEQEEAAIYRDTLCISVDSSDIELKGWRTIAQSPITYVACFKKSKRLFNESFNLEIFIDFDKASKKEQAAIFNGVHLSILSLILTKDGKNKAINVIVDLSIENSVQDLVLSGTGCSIQFASEYTSTLLPYQRSFKFFNRNKQIVVKQDISELLIVDRIKLLWRDFGLKIGDQIRLCSFYKEYIIFWVLFLLLLLRWFYPALRFVVPFSARWHSELFIFVMISIIVMSWLLARCYISSSVWYCCFSAFCIPVSLYYLWGNTDTFLDRFKVLIGIIFAVMLLPLFAFACIVENFELIKKFFL